jgi:uncharacterized membrane protein YeaQ/YmgE (transglycosylase-associated protein family)
MELWDLIVFLIIGGVAGWLAGVIMKGGGFGLAGDIVIGIIGAVIGGVVFNALGLTTTNILGSLISATVGAAIFLFVIRLIKRA